MRKLLLYFILLQMFWLAAYAQPDISVSVDTVRDALGNGASSVQSFSITNNGDATLNWSISFYDSLSSGEDVMFTKEDNTDWTIITNQDRITDYVWITRDLTKSIFNAKFEGGYSTGSPVGTEWALGSANQSIPDSVFTDFISASGNSPQSLIGKTITLHLIEDDLYFDVDFSSFSGGGAAGGFAYTRRHMMAWYGVSQLSGALAPAASITIDVSLDAHTLANAMHYGGIVVNSDDPDTPQDTVIAELTILDPAEINVLESSIEDNASAGESVTVDLNIENTGMSDLTWTFIEHTFFAKYDGDDWTFEENQDRITENVWLTRGNYRGLFNIKQETSYDRNSRVSPIGTRWAIGTTNSPGSYGTFYSLRNQISGRFYNLPGTQLSLHLTEEDIYFDVIFSQWDVGAGGFSYTRSTVLPGWISATTSGTVVGGNTEVISVTLDANGLDAGTYNYNLEVRSNDMGNPLVIVPITFSVLGTPELSTNLSYDFGNVFIGVANTYEMIINNTGSDTLRIADIQNDSAEFVPLSTSLEILPGSSGTVPVTFTPSYAGFTSDTLRIASNDTTNPVIKVYLTGTGIELPELKISTYELSETIDQDSIKTDTFYITNIGLTNLNWSIGYVNNIGQDQSGLLFPFSKENFANIDLAINRDSITPTVSLYRGDDGELQNYLSSSIEWALGTTHDVLTNGIPYDDFKSAVSNDAKNLPGKTLSLHIIDEDLYVDIEFTQWTSGHNGGGYSYTRTYPMNSWVMAAGISSGNSGTLAPADTEKVVVTYSGEYIVTNSAFNGEIVFFTNVPTQANSSVSVSLTCSGINPEVDINPTSIDQSILAEGIASASITISNTGVGNLIWSMGDPVDIFAPEKFVIFKPSGGDYNLPEHQDRITDNVWLTRGHDRGLFNIAQEAGYNRNNNSSPIGTEWAHGHTEDAGPEKYGTWYQLHNQNTPSLVGKQLSLHLIEEDIYFDVEFTTWISDGDGGGFGYIRHEPYKSAIDQLSVSRLSGSVKPGDSHDVTIMFDAANLNAGTYSFEAMIYTNDSDEPEITIPINIEVFGNPEIEVPVTELSFEETYENSTSALELRIKNNGNAELQVSNISIDESAFSISSSSFTVAPGSDYMLDISFTPTALQAYTGTMTITSNDPVTPSTSVSLSGQGIASPSLSVDVTSIEEFLFTGETSTHEIVITNNGDGVLNWSFTPEDVYVEFEKEDYASWTLEENMDKITSNVWLTRANERGLYNSVVENSYDRNSRLSPLGTEWAVGTTANPGSYGRFYDLRNQIPNRFNSLVGTPLSLHLVEEDLYYDLVFNKWTQDGEGGGFAYKRTFAQGTMSTDWVYLSKESGSLATGLSETITVIFNPLANTPEGEYLREFVLRSNDPDGLVPMHLLLSIGDVIVSDPIADTAAEAGFISVTREIANVFTAPPATNLTYQVSSSNTGVVDAQVSGTTLTINEQGLGTSEIMLTAFDGKGGSGSNVFTFDVRNRVVANDMDDVRLLPGFGSTNIDISSAFTNLGNYSDVDVTSSNEASIAATLSGTTLTLTEGVIGASDITLSVDDGIDQIVSTAFEARINSAPVITSPIADVIEDEGFVTHDIDLANVFDDADMDPLSYIVTSSNTNAAYVTVNGNTLTIIEIGVGQTEVTVSATDGYVQTAVSDTFNVTINSGTAIYEISVANFELYPNPSKGFVTLNLFDMFRGEAQITIFSINGKQVFAEEYSVFDNKLKLDVSNLSKGVYIVRFKSDTMRGQNKLVIE